MNSFYPSNRHPLPQTAYIFLPLGSVKPKGWLKDQLRIQADGQSGLLPSFWDSLGPNSGWRGGTGESWERGPYYLDGYLPMAYLLEDQKMIDFAQEWIEWAIQSQDAFGHFGPKGRDVDWWPFAIIMKVLTQYYEVTSDERVITLMKRFFKYMQGELPHNHMRSWAIVRWADMVINIIWLYNRTGDKDLLDLAEECRKQGYDWSWHFNDFGHTEKQTKRFRMRTHVVNNAMGVKTPAIQYQLTHWPEHKAGADVALFMLDEYHGTAVGLFTGDEHYGGKSPIQGTEVCAVVEYMFSLEHLIQTLGGVVYGDRLERLAYNALPGTFDEKMMAHQYDQQANQVLCTIEPRPWTNNHMDSNVFGLEPNYGCCTANFHQGWPKFIANLWMATNDDGLAAVAYGPSTVTAKVMHGREVTIDTATEYPFEETIKMTVTCQDETEFPLELRIPAWTKDATVKVNGEAIIAEAGKFARVMRKWNNGDTIEIALPMPVEVERRFNNSASIKRGPLVYSLKIGEKWERVRGEEPCPDYAVYPTTDWNYALSIDTEAPEVKIEKKPLGPVIFGSDKAPIVMTVKGKKLPDWGMEENCAAPPPVSPVKTDQPVEELTLIPYGCAKLRITEFPVAE